MTPCAGKRCYGRAREAWRALGKVMGRRGSRRASVGLAPYLCPACGSWHLGRGRRR